jgi:hypothetical protein
MSPEEILKQGLLFVGFSIARQQSVQQKKNEERFRAFFGVWHKAVAALVKDLQTTTNTNARVDKIDLKYFFLALYFLKSYDTEIILSGWWGFHEETARTWIWWYLKKIQAMKGEKVSLWWL